MLCISTSLRYHAVRTLMAGILLAIGLPRPGFCAAQNWPSFRGPSATGVAEGYPTPTTWDLNTGENIRWKTPIPGLAHSSPVIWGDRIFVTTAVKREGESILKVGLYGDIESETEDTVFEWRLYCIHRKTGDVLWTRLCHSGMPKVKRHAKSTHANATACTNGEFVVAFFGAEGLYCYDVDGNPIWQKDLGVLDWGFFRAPAAQWGGGSSPIIHNDMVILQCDVQKDSFLAAYALKDGAPVWKTPRHDVPTWGTPTVHATGEHPQIIVNGFKHIGAYEIETGEEIWRMTGGGDIPVPTPIVAHDLIYITNAHGRMSPVYAVKLCAAGDISLKGDESSNQYVAWSHPKGGNYMTTPILWGDYLYCCSNSGMVSCFNATTGELAYRERLGASSVPSSASPVAANGTLYFSGEKGDIYVVQAGPEFKVIAVNKMYETCMATPAISHGTLFFRTRNYLVAVAEDRASGDDHVTVPTPADARQASWTRHLALQQNSPYKALQWRAIGPRRQGGRIETIACPPGNTATLYVGAGSGNLWKTVNNGITWTPIFENQSAGAMGDVAVSRSNPDVVWLGTGEVLMARSALPGMGVFKSTDAGATWKHMGLHDTHHIGRVLIDPEDDNIVYVAAIGHQYSANTQRGIFKTIDGGMTWQRVLYVNEFTSAIDMVIDPGDRHVLYATTWHRDLDGQDHFGAHSGVHKSMDAGRTWTKLGGGLPQGDHVGRIGIDVAATNPNVVYALADEGREDHLYRSNDGGKTWNTVNETPLQAGWDWCEIRVSPDNENEVYSIGQRSLVSRDGGKTFERLGGTIARLLPHPSRELHLDTHAMWIDPLNTNRIVFGNDGGLFVSYDRGANWLHVNNLPIAEVYAVTYDMDTPYNVYIGTQDNAALYGPSTHQPEDGGPDDWEFVYVDRWGGGDSYFTYRDPSDPDTMYYEHQYGDMVRKSMSTGATKHIKPRVPRGSERLRFAWMTPFFPSTHQATTLYCAANRVFKSQNRGDKWSAISPDLTLGTNPPNIRYRAVTALAESPRLPGLLYAGTDNGNLYVTRNDGQDWAAISAGLPRYDITRVTPSPHDERKVFVTLTGMASDDFRPYVFRSNDQGKTWKSISSSLPLEPIYVIREDPHVEDLLFIGTMKGVYVSSDGGAHWQSLCNNLPTTAVFDLAIHPRDNELIAGTHGRSVFVLDISTLQAR